MNVTDARMRTLRHSHARVAMALSEAITAAGGLWTGSHVDIAELAGVCLVTATAATNHMVRLNIVKRWRSQAGVPFTYSLIKQDAPPQ